LSRVLASPAFFSSETRVLNCGAAAAVFVMLFAEAEGAAETGAIASAETTTVTVRASSALRMNPPCRESDEVMYSNNEEYVQEV
jgi:hypothetical protein